MNIKVILFLLSFVVLSIGGLFYFSPSLNLLIIFIVTYLSSVLSINLGWHRYFSHKSFKTSKPIENLFLFFGSSLFFGRISDWIKEHRDHHTYLNTTKDPQKTLESFFKRAYWMCYYSVNDTKTIDSEFDNRYFIFINKNSILSSILSNIILVLITSFFVVDELPVVIWLLVFVRICLIFNIYTLTHACGHNSRLSFFHYLNLGEGDHEDHHAKPKKIHNGLNLTSLIYKLSLKMRLFYE
jgi:stearoyl-CoA desaturase (delta-9 desaturase)